MFLDSIKINNIKLHVSKLDIGTRAITLLPDYYLHNYYI